MKTDFATGRMPEADDDKGNHKPHLGEACEVLGLAKCGSAHRLPLSNSANPDIRLASFSANEAFLRLHANRRYRSFKSATSHGFLNRRLSVRSRGAIPILICATGCNLKSGTVRTTATRFRETGLTSSASYGVGGGFWLTYRE